MAFHAISQELLPQFSDNLEKGSSAFSGRSSLQTAQELGLRHMLHKENRTSARIGDDIYDTKAMNNKASVLSDAAGSTKIGGPTWLSNALMRQQSAATPFLEGDQSSRKWCGCEPAGSHCVHSSFLHLKTQPTAGVSKSSAGKTLPSSCTQWLSNKVDENPGITSEFLGEDVPSESLMGLSTQHSHISAEISRSTSQRGAGLRDIHSEAANNSELIDATDAGDYEKHHNTWQTSSVKAEILSHPLYEQLLAAHVACLRIATPVDQIPKIDAQLAQAHSIAAKYSAIGDHHLPVGEQKDELDQFMTHYVLLLCSFKEQLQQHVRVHAMDAVMACWELEQNLVALTGVSPGEGTGATMSDDDDDNEDSDPFLYDTGLDGQDNGGFGPLIPTETERSLMERVRQELKAELKHGYKDRIVDVREEILRKRRAGKLPGDTTSVLKSWWHAHSKWPYPTEDEKARLVQETGLQLKQINNWFINQRKRNWHSNPSSSLKAKRKRG